MKKLTPQILAMYLGCQCKAQINYFEQSPQWVNGTIFGVSLSSIIVLPKDVNGKNWPHTVSFDDFSKVELCLGRLSDMTEEEAREFAKLEGWGENLENIVVTDRALEFEQVLSVTRQQCVSWFSRLRPDAFAYLLSKSFDLFGLIDAGEAIDEKTLNA